MSRSEVVISFSAPDQAVEHGVRRGGDAVFPAQLQNDAGEGGNLSGMLGLDILKGRGVVIEGVWQQFAVELLPVAVRIRPEGIISGGCHDGKNLIHDVVHNGNRLWAFGEGAVVDAQHRTQRVEGAVIQHLGPERLGHFIAGLSGEATPIDGGSQFDHGGTVQAVQTAQQHRGGVDCDFAHVGSGALKAGDDPGIPDLTLVKETAIGPVVAPAILEQDNFALGLEQLPVFAQRLADLIVGQSLGADEDKVEAVGGKGGIVVRDSHLLRRNVQVAEQTGTVDASGLNGLFCLAPGKEGDLLAHAGQPSAHGHADGPCAGDENVHWIHLCVVNGLHSYYNTYCSNV